MQDFIRCFFMLESLAAGVIAEYIFTGHLFLDKRIRSTLHLQPSSTLCRDFDQNQDTPLLLSINFLGANTFYQGTYAKNHDPI